MVRNKHQEDSNECKEDNHEYLLTESEVFTGKSQTETARSTREGCGLRFSCKDRTFKAIRCLLYGFLLWFWGPPIGRWVLRENNALQLTNRIISRIISAANTSHIIMPFIIWLCLTRTGNYRIHEFDWLKSILTAV